MHGLGMGCGTATGTAPPRRPGEGSFLPFAFCLLPFAFCLLPSAFSPVFDPQPAGQHPNLRLGVRQTVGLTVVNDLDFVFDLAQKAVARLGQTVTILRRQVMALGQAVERRQGFQLAHMGIFAGVNELEHLADKLDPPGCRRARA